MKSAVQAAVFLVILFAIPLIPFALLGTGFEDQLLTRLRQPAAPGTVAAWIVALLALDMFLPVPSTAVMTYAGGVLGPGVGALVSWFGLSVGGLAGFGLARVFGDPLARRFSEPDDAERMRGFVRRHGVLALIVTRALPILAEACVLMLGVARMSWAAFLGGLLITNLLLSVVYAACGAWFRDSPQFALIVALSGTIPLIAALAIRIWWKPAIERQPTHDSDAEPERENQSGL